MFLLNKNIELVSRRVVAVREEILIGGALLVDGRCRDQARRYAAYVAQFEDAVVDPRGTG